MPFINKCIYCAKKIEIKEREIIFYNNHYYHLQCFKEIKDSINNIDFIIENKMEFLDYIDKLYNLKIFDDLYMENKFSEDLKTLLKLNYSYSGIMSTIFYIINVKKKNIDSNTGIFIVKYYYDEAKRFFDQQYQFNKEMEEKANEILKEELKERTLYIELRKDTFEKKLIDMTKL